MNRRQGKLLLQLATFLRTQVPSSAFNLDHFFTVRISAVGEKLQQILNGVNKCGSTACAIGWMPIALPKYFRFGGRFPNCFVAEKDGRKKYGEAAEKIFGINDEAIYFLFYPESYHPQQRKPKHVARRLENFVQKGFPRYWRVYPCYLPLSTVTYRVPNHQNMPKENLQRMIKWGTVDEIHQRIQKELGFDKKKMKLISQ